jgi:hypothetical protein
VASAAQHIAWPPLTHWRLTCCAYWYCAVGTCTYVWMDQHVSYCCVVPLLQRHLGRYGAGLKLHM